MKEDRKVNIGYILGSILTQYCVHYWPNVKIKRFLNIGLILAIRIGPLVQLKLIQY